MMSIERIRWLLKESNLRKVSNVTKVPYGTLYDVIKKENINPSYFVVRELSRYLNDKINSHIE